MTAFPKKGVVTSGLVGVLSLILLVGVGFYLTYFTVGQSQNPSTEAANRPVQKEDLGLVVSSGPMGRDGKSDVTAVWKTMSSSDLGAKWTLTLRSADSKLPAKSEERVFNATTTRGEFKGLDLGTGKYLVRLRYIPTEGTIQEQSVNLVIGN